MIPVQLAMVRHKITVFHHNLDVCDGKGAESSAREEMLHCSRLDSCAIAHDFRTVAGQSFYAAKAGACSASYWSGDL